MKNRLSFVLVVVSVPRYNLRVWAVAQSNNVAKSVKIELERSLGIVQHNNSLSRERDMNVDTECSFVSHITPKSW